MSDLVRALLGLLEAIFRPRATTPPATPVPPAPRPPTPVPAARPVLAKPQAFYDELRKDFGRLPGPFVAGTEGLLQALAVFPLSWAAYALATAYHETGRTMQPVHEKGMGDRDGDGEDDYFEKYDTGPIAARLGNTPEHDGDGQRYAGRGFVQLTGRANYAKAGKYVGQDLVADPDLALRPDVAAAIMVLGMRAGWFTGHKLADYLPANGPATRAAFTQARHIINGTDRAEIIAAYADAFQDALMAGGWSGR